MSEPPRSVRVSIHTPHAPVGARPDALVVPEGSPIPKIRVIAYTKDKCEEREIDELSELKKFLSKYDTTWVSVQGFGDEATLREIGDMFALHPLALADLVSHQRPKTESYEGEQIFICNAPRIEGEDLIPEQVGMVLSRKYLLTFEEKPSARLDPVRKRLREGAGLLRTSGTDHLGYAIIDLVVDAYYPVLEVFAERIEALEEEVIARPQPRQLERVHHVKRSLLMVRRSIWPLRDALGTLLRDPIPMVTDSARVYLRDTYDHTIQIAEMSELYRELVGELTNTYLSVLGNRTNDVMRVLTVVTTIFIPLTFIVGVYGMNFDYMPELRAHMGYPVTVGVMLTIAVVMLVYFRRRGWLGKPPDA
jgi:magnesium transporter